MPGEVYRPKKQKSGSGRSPLSSIFTGQYRNQRHHSRHRASARPAQGSRGSLRPWRVASAPMPSESDRLPTKRSARSGLPRFSPADRPCSFLRRRGGRRSVSVRPRAETRVRGGVVRPAWPPVGARCAAWRPARAGAVERQRRSDRGGAGARRRDAGRGQPILGDARSPARRPDTLDRQCLKNAAAASRETCLAAITVSSRAISS